MGLYADPPITEEEPGYGAIEEDDYPYVDRDARNRALERGAESFFNYEDRDKRNRILEQGAEMVKGIAPFSGLVQQLKFTEYLKGLVLKGQEALRRQRENMVDDRLSVDSEYVNPTIQDSKFPNNNLLFDAFIAEPDKTKVNIELPSPTGLSPRPIEDDGWEEGPMDFDPESDEWDAYSHTQQGLDSPRYRLSDTGRLLLGRNHDQFDTVVKEFMDDGYTIYKDTDGYYYANASSGELYRGSPIFSVAQKEEPSIRPALLKGIDMAQNVGKNIQNVTRQIISEDMVEPNALGKESINWDHLKEGLKNIDTNPL